MPDASCFSLSTIDWLPSPSNSALKISSLHPSTTTDCGVYPFSPEWVKLPPIVSPYLQSHSFLTCPLSCLHGHLFQRPEVIMLFLFNNFLGPVFGTRESLKSIAWHMILMTGIFLFVFSASISVYLLFFWKKKVGESDWDLCPSFANSLMRETETNFSFLHFLLCPQHSPQIFSSAQMFGHN